MKTLYKALMASAAVLALSTASAKAADPFSGLYIGAHAGYSFSAIDASAVGVSWNANGSVIGAHAGYGWRIKGLYVGFEGDFSILNGSGDIFGVTASFDWMATARGRLGLPIGNAMPYLTAGAAWGKGGIEAGPISQMKTETGFAYGGGVDFAIFPSTIARIEYLHVDFGGIGDVLGVGLKADASVVRAGVSFNLN